MNNKICGLLEWANNKDISLDSATIDSKNSVVTFHQYRETRDNFRKVKRAVDGFEKEGEPPYVKLGKRIILNDIIDGEEVETKWRLVWDGAYECKSKGYDCKPTAFEDDEQDNIETFRA